jgi:hypothetical protein
MRLGNDLIDFLETPAKRTAILACWSQTLRTDEDQNFCPNYLHKSLSGSHTTFTSFRVNNAYFNLNTNCFNSQQSFPQAL